MPKAFIILMMIEVFLIGLLIGTVAERFLRRGQPVLPCTCAVGDIFLQKDGRQYLCVEENTWR